MIIFLVLLGASGKFYTESEISELCNADSNPPSLGPGTLAIERIRKLKPKVYLEEYYKENDYELDYEDKVSYAQDLMPYGFFLYLGVISVIIWIMYFCCIVCKCCYCIIGPAIRVQERRQKVRPLILMGISIIFILGFAGVGVYYLNELQGAMGYMACVVARWSGGYFYGYSEWEGIYNLNNHTFEVIGIVNADTQSIESVLSPLNDSGIANITQEMENLMVGFIDSWKDTESVKNRNYGNYSYELPEAYGCGLCLSLEGYLSRFRSDLESLIEPLSENITGVIDEAYFKLINDLKNLTSSLEQKFDWSQNLTDLYSSYENRNLGFFYKLNSIKDGMFGNTLFIIGLSFILSGMMFMTSLILSEGCIVYKNILINENLGNIFVIFTKSSDGSQALEFCYYSNGKFNDFLNITQDFSFIPTLISSYSNILFTNFSDSYQIPTLVQLSERISKSTVNSFISTQDPKVHWNGPSEINFFLFEKTSESSYSQNSYLNNFTIYSLHSQQSEKCNQAISKDFWAYSTEYCKSEYKYQSALDLTASTDKKCYVMTQEYSKDSVRERYVDQQLFEKCEEVDGIDFDEEIVQYWIWADNAYDLDKNFSLILTQLNDEFSGVNQQIEELVNKVYKYYTGIEDSEQYLINLNEKLEEYYNAMNCSMVEDLTSQLYLGLCGEIIDYLFFLSLFVGVLGFSLFLFSLSVVLVLFRFRTDLEIEQDTIIRSIGKEKDNDPEATDRVNETIIMKNIF